jgi:type VI secretion system FHA domain protein
LERFLRGAEIEDPGFLNAAELPEFIEVLGAVFREMVNGLWRILRGRSELKAEMRLAMTMVRPTGNNPLKFSPRLEDAVKSLIKKGHPSFLEPLEAVTDGFDDIMNHELALHAGMQASLAESLSHFDPECFNEKNKHGSIMQTKGHLWKAYCEAYPELREAAMDGVFGKAFAGAYEDQLAKLRSQRKKD